VQRHKLEMIFSARFDLSSCIDRAGSFDLDAISNGIVIGGIWSLRDEAKPHPHRGKSVAMRKLDGPHGIKATQGPCTGR
jgi:hypothetical protein